MTEMNNNQAPSNNSKGFSIAALVCGILGIIGSFIPVVCYFTFVLAILGIIFGIMGRKRAGGKSGLATAGLVLGARHHWHGFRPGRRDLRGLRFLRDR